MRRREFLAWAAFGGIAACRKRDSDDGSEPKIAATSGSSSVTTSAVMGAAVVIGVDQVDHTKYLSWGDKLCGAESDAVSFWNFLRACKFQFVTPEPLLGFKAEREPVAAAIRLVGKKTQPGQTACIYFAGHGGQAKSSLTKQFDPRDTDGIDQSWCLHDGPLFDNELYWLLQAFHPACRVLIVSDSCYGGGMYGFNEAIAAMSPIDKLLGSPLLACKPPLVRSMPVDIGEEVYKQWESGLATLKRDPPPATSSVNVEVISACGRTDLAYEVDGHGVFTSALLAVLENAVCRETYAKVFHDVTPKISKFSTPQRHTLQNAQWTDWFTNDLAFCAT